MPVPTVCNCCGGQVRLAGQKEVYHKDFSDWPWLYLCKDCGAYVGLHPYTAIPLGTLADKATRKERRKCKQPFESIWKGRIMTRSSAYEWLAGKLGIPVEQCHFGLFDIQLCQQVAQICTDFMGKYK